MMSRNWLQVKSCLPIKQSWSSIMAALEILLHIFVYIYIFLLPWNVFFTSLVWTVEYNGNRIRVTVSVPLNTMAPGAYQDRSVFESTAMKTSVSKEGGRQWILEGSGKHREWNDGVLTGQRRLMMGVCSDWSSTLGGVWFWFCCSCDNIDLSCTVRWIAIKLPYQTLLTTGGY